MTPLEQCVSDLIALAQSDDPNALDEQMDRCVAAYLACVSDMPEADARNQLAIEFGDQAPETELRERMLERLALHHPTVAGGSADETAIS
jgi:hypothetical protein